MTTLDLKSFKDLGIDSRKVGPGTLFFAIEGSSQDGHDHLAQVVANKASGIVVSKPEKVPKEFSGKVHVVKDVREELAKVCSLFFNKPDQELKLIGVTGTNGKTTSVYMLEHLLNSRGSPTAVLGTIDHHFQNHIWPSQLTTPDILSLYQRLSQVLSLGAKSVAMEISSHALDQKRVKGLDLDIGIWTNFTRDHLDYHGSEDAYFAAKKILFEENLKTKSGFALFNGDDPKLKSLKASGATSYTFGQIGDFRFQVTEKKVSHSKFQLTSPFGDADFFLPTPGVHNIYNAVGAIAACLCLGHSIKELPEALSSFYGTKGRLELVPNDKNLNVFIDYAHTPDAIRTSLLALKELMQGGSSRLWIVFGFGGNRDKGKRPLMVAEALKLADHLVLTSDNPRFEDPLKIIDDGLTVVPKESIGKSVHILPERKDAISFALQSARENDVILIAGKGHEEYQIKGNDILPFSDKGTVLELLR